MSYAWDFGDGSTATGATPAPHTYAAAGAYQVSLTVTDTNNLTSVAKTTVNPTSAQISYVGSATFNANTTRPVVTIPGATQAGDGLVLVVSYGTTTVVPTAPSGWTLKGQLVDGSTYTQVYSRVATSTDANSQVAVPLSAITRSP